MADWDPRMDITKVPVRQLGSEDVFKIIKGTEVYDLTLEYGMQTIGLPKYGINAQGGGAGSIDKSLSILAALKLGGYAGTQYYYNMLGCRPNRTTVSGRVNEPVTVRQEFRVMNIPTPTSSSPIGAGTWASDPGTAPIAFWSGGAAPVSIGSSSVSPIEMSVTVERNVEDIFVLGSTLAATLPPKHRDITASMSLLWLNEDRKTDMKNFTDRTVVWTLSTGVAVLTLTNCKFHRLSSFTIKPSEVVIERWEITPLSVALASS